MLLAAAVTLAVALITFFFKRIVAGGRRLVGWLWRRLRVERGRDAVYRRQLAKRLRELQILQMSEAKDLQVMFIPLKLGRWASPGLKPAAAAAAAPTPTLSLEEALRAQSHITILGYPGAGKTTISSHAAALAADRTLRLDGRPLLPLHLTLRHIRDTLEPGEDTSLRTRLIGSVEALGFAEAAGFVDRKLADGHCLIVLDGFDELADVDGSLQQRLALKVRELTATIHAENRIVLTSRPAGYEPAWFPGFTVLEVSEFEPAQARMFIERWFGPAGGTRVEALCAQLEANAGLRLIVRNPLMLAIVCFVHAADTEQLALPQSRVDLYERCIHALIEDWDRTRGIKRPAGHTPREVEQVLQYVAYDALLAGRIDFSRRQLLAMIRASLPKAGLRRYDDQGFLREVIEHTGLLREKARDTFGFVHLAFLEYLAAQVIVERVEDGLTAADLEAHVSDTRWAEPIALAVGVMRGRTELLRLLYELYARDPTDDLMLLIAACLRDADVLEHDGDLPDELLLVQDRILARVVDAAGAADADSARLHLQSIGHERVGRYVDRRLDAGRTLATRPELLEALATTTGAASVTRLHAAADDPQEAPETRARAVRRLGSLGAGAGTVALLTRLLDTSDDALRGETAAALARLRVSEAVPRLTELLDAGTLYARHEQDVRDFLASIEPPRLGAFVLRPELPAIERALRADGVVCLIGLAGIGKTTLAMQILERAPHPVKRRVSAAYPDELRLELARPGALIVVDDVDDASPAVAAFVADARAAEADVVVVGRMVPPIDDAATVTLGPLDDEASRALLASIDPQLPEGVVRAILETAAGIPLFISELARPAGPPRLTEITNHVIEQAGAVGLRWLTVLAHLDEPVDVASPPLADVFATETLADETETIERLQRHGLVVLDAGGVRFAHRLIRQAVLERTDRRTRLRIQAMIAELSG